MSGPIGAAALIGISYLIGALPFGLLAGRLAGGIDLRRHGSQRTGATNALRTLGLAGPRPPSCLTWPRARPRCCSRAGCTRPGRPGSPEWVAAAAGIAAVVGHNLVGFIGFSGGRGVATSAGGSWSSRH